MPVPVTGPGGSPAKSSSVSSVSAGVAPLLTREQQYMKNTASAASASHAMKIVRSMRLQTRGVNLGPRESCRRRTIDSFPSDVTPSCHRPAGLTTKRQWRYASGPLAVVHPNRGAFAIASCVRPASTRGSVLALAKSRLSALNVAPIFRQTPHGSIHPSVGVEVHDLARGCAGFAWATICGEPFGFMPISSHLPPSSRRCEPAPTRSSCRRPRS